jgi:hypothetical protein
MSRVPENLWMELVETVRPSRLMILLTRMGS